jgi:ABC-type cobalamin/Fe3+-siderophores transport system ATPase subunit
MGAAMRIAHLKISNILGITDLEVSPGRFVEITGANGVNKSSILNAIKSVVEGGHDATLLRNGAERGEVVLLLDDGVELRKTVTAKASRVEVKKGDVVMRRPQETISSLADLFSVNPIAFLSAPKADRARVMLESMPISLDRDRLAAIVGAPVAELAPGVHALAALDLVRRGIYDERTACNSVLKEKRATIEQLKQAMPEPVGEGAWNEAQLEEEAARIEKACEQELEQLQLNVDAWMAARDGRVAEHQAALAEIARQTAVAHERRTARMAEIRQARSTAMEPIAVQLGLVKVNRNAIARRAQTIETMNTLAEQAKVAEDESTQRTAALDAIDAYKQELLANLPIANVEVINGEIYRGGVPFDRLNTSQRISIAVDLARLRAGKLGVVCIDGAEALDSKTMDAFRAATAQSDLQFFVTKVTDGALHVASDPPVNH